MRFISYAQNNEDVLLWRALGDLQHGFYIDVGANDPVEHSVTKAFYDAGWNGINIEPLPAHIAAFGEQRPRDVNLAIAAGSRDGELTLYDVPAVRGWASPDQAVAEAHRAEGHEVAELTVPVRTLASVCEEYVKGEIHFLKVDVEGFEGEVLRGMDFARWRPWVLVIEATVPGSRETNHAAWEHLVTGQRYRYAWFDGLNRYYVAEEHAELLAHFGIQPNVFDDFIPHHLDSAWRQIGVLQESVGRIAALEAHTAEGWERAADMERSALAHQALHRQAANEAALLAQQCEQLRLEKQTMEAQLHQSAAWGKEMEQRLLAVLDSTSWRITAPMRFVMRRGPDSMAGIARRKAKGAARRSLRWLTSREALRRTVLPLVMRSPRLQALTARTLAAAKQATADSAAPASAVPYALRELPQSAREALDQLRHAYAPHKE
ncbi:FkbM family methyltransferase [Massilia sp. LXY-6]|uniref:FkbM family methyltransferase n=1 Tax=Massilia sp. LXY-6 TaxID=3379823 RepID=UPI003EDFE99D